MTEPPLRVGVAGLGAIGAEAARWLTGAEGFTLSGVCGRDRGRAAAQLAQLDLDPALERDVEQLAQASDVVLEAAPASAFRAIAEPVLAAGCRLMAMSAGALLANWDLAQGRANGAPAILLPSGAVGGLDAIRAAAVTGSIASVKLVSTKPPSAFAGNAFLAARWIDPASMSIRQRLFSGSAREAAKHFPANANVAALVALAGAGPERTRVEIWVDPAASGNRHVVSLRSTDLALRVDLRSAAASQPRTSRLAVASAIAALRNLASPLLVGC